MTVGAAGACNVILKSILDPGDEVIVLLPYFAEYQFYISNHGGRMVQVETDASFLPDIERIRAAITPRTRAILLNTPNNPTGRVYPESTLRALQTMLAEIDHPILVISDEPYKAFVYDGKTPAGGLFVHRQHGHLQLVVQVAGLAGRAHRLSGALAAHCGFRAPARRLHLQQSHSRFCQRTRNLAAGADGSRGRSSRRHRLRAQAQRPLRCAPENRLPVPRPEGAFYIFLKTPIPDDIAFTELLANEGVLAVPGVGFGRAGYVRLSLTIPLERIQKSIGGFERAFLASRR